MNLLTKNALSNVLTKGISLALSIFFVPVFISYVGVESYAFVGIYTTIQSIFIIFDSGLSAAYTREIAKLSTNLYLSSKKETLYRTFEKIYIFLSILIFILLFSFSEIIADWFGGTKSFTKAEINELFILIFICISLHFLIIFYQAGLNALQKHVLLNKIILTVSLIKNVGTVIIFEIFTDNVFNFFYWHLCSLIFQICLLKYYNIYNLGHNKKDGNIFDFDQIKNLYKFAIGTSGTIISGMIISQSDKIILSNLLTLENFGFYTVAISITSIPILIATSLNTAVYPQFVQKFHLSNLISLSKLYTVVTTVLFSMVIPIFAVFFIFTEEIFFLWTGVMEINEFNSYVIRLNLFSTIFMCSMIIPYSLQLAIGWTRLSFTYNLIYLFILPIFIYLSYEIDIKFAVSILPVYYFFQFIILLPITHKKIFGTFKFLWVLKTIIFPCLFSLTLNIAIRNLFDGNYTRFECVIIIISSLLLNFILLIFSYKIIRSFISSKIFNYKL